MRIDLNTTNPLSFKQWKRYYDDISDASELSILYNNYLIEWKDKKVNQKHVKKYKNNDIKLLKKFFSEINLRNVEGPPEKIIEIPTETEGTEGTESCAMELDVLQIPGIEDENFTPFINNSCELHQDLKQACDDAASAVKFFFKCPIF